MQDKKIKTNKKKKYSQLNAIWMGIFADILGFSFMVSLLPEVNNSFNTTSFQATLLLSSNAMFGIIFGPIWGKLSDKYGRKPTLIICQTGTLLSFLIFAIGQNYKILLLSRILDGIFGGNFLIANAIIGDVVDKKDRIKFMGNISLIFALSNILGPGISALLISLGQGMLFPGLFGMILSGLSIISSIFFLPETLKKCESKIPTLELNNESNSNKLTYTRVEKNNFPKFKLIQWAFYTLALTLVYSSISLYAYENFHLSAESLGILLMTAGIFQILFRMTLFMPIIRKLGEKKSALVGLIISCVIYFSLTLINQKWQLICIILFQGVAAALVRSVLSSQISKSVESYEQGKIQGFKSALDSLGQLFGPLFGGLLITFAPNSFFGLCSGLIALCALGFGMFPYLQKKKSKENYQRKINSEICIKE
ncbi:MFS transporter [Promethearchaeum syntrophicum]|uniref:MFS transporter n=1 Tax=Promethearchaeum syntrophicum TaxID=2594042 RepID=A0A5B9DCM7_9ARCH|nr:MFS transporter [Candidatus Prometheoarchaeum syntrophicum]